MKPSIYSLLAFFALLTGCLPEPLEIDVPQAESKLVVSSQIIPDNIMLVTVTRSFSALEGSYGSDLGQEDLEKVLVKRALVTLSYGNRTDTLFSLPESPGVFASLLRLSGEGQTFDLYVYDSTSQQSVTSRSTMLSRIGLDDASVETKVSSLDTSYALNYTFNDPDGDNWYVLNVFDPNEIGQQGLGENFSFDGSSNTHTELISDKLFNTSEITGTAEILDQRFGDTVAVMLSNISEEYFRFLDARKRVGGILASVTGEPINHPSNIIGGYGFFNTHNPSISVVAIKE